MVGSAARSAGTRVKHSGKIQELRLLSIMRGDVAAWYVLAAVCNHIITTRRSDRVLSQTHSPLSQLLMLCRLAVTRRTERFTLSSECYIAGYCDGSTLRANDTHYSQQQDRCTADTVRVCVCVSSELERHTDVTYRFVITWLIAILSPIVTRDAPQTRWCDHRGSTE